VANNSTYCPTEFDEFFKQRRRWIPSTLANQVLVLQEWKSIQLFNKNISFLFMIYQGLLLFSSLINPAVSILVIVG
jgi:chitin synthase